MKRKLFDKLYKHTKNKETTVVIGARQTGKTTLLGQLQRALADEGKITEFFNLEDRTILSDLNDNPLNLLRYLPETNDRVYVFLDEIQYLREPSHFLKLIYDEHSDRIKLIVTGSSAFYIDKKFTDSLAGRKRIFFLPTCSFAEYLELADRGELVDELGRILGNPEAKLKKRALMEQEWESYIIYGGYPAVACERDTGEKRAILQELRDSFLRRDIYESRVEKEDDFYRLMRIIAAGSGNLVNVSELSNTLRINAETVNRYMTVMRKCCHISLVKPYYSNIRKELTKMPKAYLSDTGMRNCLLNYFPEKLGINDDGALFETYVFHVLAERYGEDEIFFWRTQDQREVDFVLPDIDVPFACEVKYNETAFRPARYKAFREAYPHIPLKLAAKEPFGEDRLRAIYTGSL